MCTSFCFLALLELTWHGSLSEQAILNTSHINYWFLSKCNCSQGNIPFYNFDSKVFSFYWDPHTPRKWTDKKTDGHVNLRNVRSGQPWVGTSWALWDLSIPFPASTLLESSFLALKAINRNKIIKMTQLHKHYKRQGSNKYGCPLSPIFQNFPEKKIMLTSYALPFLGRNDSSHFCVKEACH